MGIDLGLTTFAALSDGSTVPTLRAARRAQHRLRIAPRSLARKRRDSKSRAKARAALARVHRQVQNQRRNHLHQASSRLVRDYDVIVVERLRFAALAKSKLAKAVNDASWAEFVSMLRYKAECAGARLIEVDPHDTSLDCSRCGSRVDKDLSERTHDCQRCGLSIDRDLNAAINILHRAGVGPGLRNVAPMASVQAETSA